MEEDTQSKQTENTGTQSIGWPALTIDWDLFGQCLENSDLSDDEIRETIQVYWSIVVGFVDLGLGIHPVQLATKTACEQNPQNGKLSPCDTISVVNCLHSPLSETKRQTALVEFAASATDDEVVKGKPQKEGATE